MKAFFLPKESTQNSNMQKISWSECEQKDVTHIRAFATTDQCSPFLLCHSYKFQHLLVLFNRKEHQTHCLQMSMAVDSTNDVFTSFTGKTQQEALLGGHHTWPALTRGPNRQPSSKGSPTLILDAQVPIFLRNSSAIPSYCNKTPYKKTTCALQDVDTSIQNKMDMCWHIFYSFLLL